MDRQRRDEVDGESWSEVVEQRENPEKVVI